MDFDFNKIDQRWNKIWAENHVYEPDLNKNIDKKFITAAFPYPNSPQHVGHGRTYTTADIYARFMRLMGYNVLFPMAFHVTGTPILAMAQRLKDGDEELIRIFEDIYHIPRNEIAKLTEPKKLVMYFSKEVEMGMKEMGFSIDWRRKFYTMDVHFNRYIEWQFKKLYAAGLITKGEHVVPWCPRDKNPVGSHDTKGDVDPELEEITGILFKFEDSYLMAATYRPETIYGITNIWVNPNVVYVKVKTKHGNIWFAKEAYDILKFQFPGEIIDQKDGNYFIGKNAIELMDNRKIPIYEATFVKPDTGTGVVMSVPAHAPFDYLALRDLVGKEKADHMLISIIKTNGFSEYPAKQVVEELNVIDQNDPKAEEATKLVYAKESRHGVMSTGKYTGVEVKKAKEFVRNDLIASKKAISLFIIANSPVYCRCGARIVPNIVKNQWFINYGDEKLKQKARTLVNKMSIIPDKLRIEYIRTIDWLKEKACTRAKGLGTKFPFDKSQMIEALSDSTLYMAFYTIAPYIKQINADLLDESVFDYIILNKNLNPDIKSRFSAKDLELIELSKKQFEYWYPVDSRHSAYDLVRNHLPFYIMNHVAILPEKYWPVQIVTNGFVLMDGTKMSKSFGNILPIRDAIKQYGADVVRFSVVGGADLTQDTDFNRSVADGTKSRLKLILEMAKETSKYKQDNETNKSDNSKLEPIQKWLLYMLKKRIKNAEEYYKAVDIRSIALELFYSTYSDLQWYKTRTNLPIPSEFFDNWTIAISPIMPHIAEEIWGMFHNIYDADGNIIISNLVVNQKYPNYDLSFISNDINEAESIGEKLNSGEVLIKNLVFDITKIIDLLKLKQKKENVNTNKQIDHVDIFVSSKWKYELYNAILDKKKIPNVMEYAKSNELLSKHMKEIPKVGKSWFKNVYSLSPLTLTNEEEYDVLKQSKSFLSDTFKCDVNIWNEDEKQDNPKSKNAMPNKPSIMVTFK